MTTEEALPYSQWRAEELVKRITVLETELKALNTKYKDLRNTSFGASLQKNTRDTNNSSAFDRSKYTTRHIALKFAYLGANYNGYEHSVNNVTPLPTIEEMLWRALMKAKLIFPEDESLTEHDTVSWEGCQYSKCGRTDRGVSAFGQVVGIRVRSNRRPETAQHESSLQGSSSAEDSAEPAEPLSLHYVAGDGVKPDDTFHPITDEIRYPQVINRLLPPDIRILAWCPSPPPDFSARFSCRERRYRYFFTQPAFNPTHGGSGSSRQAHTARDPHHQVVGDGRQRREGWLDIAAMREAAKKFEGLHDFRNFCKIDPSKQINDFTRRIFHSEIRELDPSEEPAACVSDPALSKFYSDLSAKPHKGSSSSPKLYVFELHGSAFLWHQVRHMVAILFLVGQGLESPSIVSQLLDTKTNPERPMYNMAEDTPLVLWDCIFPTSKDGGDGEDHQTDSLHWVYPGDNGQSSGKFGTGGLLDDTWTLWRKRKMEETLAGSLFNLVARQGGEAVDHREEGDAAESRSTGNSQKVFQGGDVTRALGQYVPLMERKRMDDAKTINGRYALRKGLEPKDLNSNAKMSGHRLETRRDHE